MFRNTTSNKSSIYETDWSKFDQENVILDNVASDWKDVLKIDELNIDNSTQMYLEKINTLLNVYAPLKRIDNYKLRFKSKSWINLSLQKTIFVKKINCLLSSLMPGTLY